MNRKQIYWLCQIVGWTTYELYEILFFSIYLPTTSGTFINGIANIIIGITITHIYKLIIEKLNWLELPISKLLPRVVISVFLMSDLMATFNIYLDKYTLTNIQPITFNIMLLGIANFGRHFIIWTSLYHTFHYFERSRKIQIEKIKLSSANKEFESKLLRSQLNPHFIFNALNSIRALILENPEKAQLSVTRLSNILRNSLLADRRKTVSLKEELKTVNDYLELEKIRYEERLNININIDPQSQEIQIPPMMLQTLVENAIKHGVSKPVEGGFIEIISKTQNGFINLVIRNTGKFEEVVFSENTSGFGLKNTEQRLSLIYGELASFTINQESENIVRAELQLPTSIINIY